MCSAIAPHAHTLGTVMTPADTKTSGMFNVIPQCQPVLFRVELLAAGVCMWRSRQTAAHALQPRSLRDGPLAAVFSADPQARVPQRWSIVKAAMPMA